MGQCHVMPANIRKGVRRKKGGGVGEGGGLMNFVSAIGNWLQLGTLSQNQKSENKGIVKKRIDSDSYYQSKGGEKLDRRSGEKIQYAFY